MKSICGPQTMIDAETTKQRGTLSQPALEKSFIFFFSCFFVVHFFVRVVGAAA